MKLSDHDLLQIDEEYLSSLSSDALLSLSRKLLLDLKESRERLNQTPDNSSKPPSTRPAFIGIPAEGDAEFSDEEDGVVLPDKDEKTEDESGSIKSAADLEASGSEGKKHRKPKGKPGKPMGAQGYGRTQKIPIQREVIHQAEMCAICDAALPPNATFTARTGYVSVDMVRGSLDQPGLRLDVSKHIFFRHHMLVRPYYPYCPRNRRTA